MIKKHIACLLTAVVLALGIFGGLTVSAEDENNAENAPSDIELSIGTVEINKSDLQEDTVAEVPLTIKNNPEFVSLDFALELDRGLSYADSSAADRKDISEVKQYYDEIPVEGCSLFKIVADGKVSGDGELMRLRIKIPKDLSAGTYRIVFSEAGRSRLSILTDNESGTAFGEGSFSKTLNGAVIIKEDTTVSQTVTSTSAQTSKPTSTTKQTTTTPKTTTTTTTTSAATAAQTETSPEVTESSPSESVPDTTTVTTTTVASAAAVVSDESEPSLSETESALESESSDGISILAIACIAGIVIGVAIVIVVVVQNKKDDDD